MSIRIIIIDDHDMFRTALRRVLAQEGDMEVLADFGDAASALQPIEKQRPDVILLDISLPGIDGLDAARIMRNADYPSRIIILSMHADAHHVSRALAEGAMGYVLKEQASDDLIDAVRQVHNGGRYLSPKLRHHNDIDSGEKPHKLLTEREIEIVKMLSNGISAMDVANTLNISIKTVETHRSNIYRKLGLKNVVELTRYAIRSGLVPL